MCTVDTNLPVVHPSPISIPGKDGHNGGYKGCSAEPTSPTGLALIRAGGALSSLIPKAENGLRLFGPEWDQFALGQTIGSGGQAQVYVCKRLAQGGTEYAAKIISLNKGENREKEAQNLRREINIMSELHHERIVNLHASFDLPTGAESPVISILVMDYAKYGDLWTRVDRDAQEAKERGEPCFLGLGGMERCTQYVTQQLLEGIGYMHEKMIIHRDLKLENVLIVRTERRMITDGPPQGAQFHDVKIADLGYSREVATDTPALARRCMSIVGTPGFAAPEVLDQKYGPAADLFSLGVMVYVMLCACQPFRRLGPLYKKITSEIDTCKAWENASEAARSFVQGLLDIDPDRRQTVAGSFIHPWLDRAEVQSIDEISLEGSASSSGAVQKIVGYVGTAVDHVELHMKKGDIRHYGKKGGEHSCKFNLKQFELIVAVTQETKRSYLGTALVFYTSEAQVCTVLGSDSKRCGRFQAPDDCQIVGLQFEGSCLVGVHVRDIPGKNEEGAVEQIRARKGYCVDQVEFVLRSGRVRRYGADGGSEDTPFVLEPDEYITIVEQARRDAFLGNAFAFFTNHGRIHEVQGMQASQYLRFAAPRGRQICGLSFEGSMLVGVATCSRSGVTATSD